MGGDSGLSDKYWKRCGKKLYGQKPHKTKTTYKYPANMAPNRITEVTRGNRSDVFYTRKGDTNHGYSVR